MADTPVPELAGGVRGLFDRVGEFFHIFDLSFVVSGACTLAAILWGIHSDSLVRGLLLPAGFSWGVAMVIGVYVLGLFSFTLGRLLNGIVFRRRVFGKFRLALEIHGLSTDERIGRYFSLGHPGMWRLYSRLWQDAILYNAKTAPVAHLSRYWVMAATYDGVAVSCLVWCMMSTFRTFAGISPGLTVTWGLFSSAVSFLTAVMCLWQGGRYYEYQIEDLVAFAASRRVALTA